MKTNTEQAWQRHQTPTAIRNEGFSRRLRGLDEDEVRDYLDLLADQVQGTERHMQELQSDNDRLRAELDRLQAEIGPLRELADRTPAEERVNDQVVELFSQAQLVAEEMVEDVSREARQRLGQAREQERKIIEEAMQTAQRTLRDAQAMVMRTGPGPSAGYAQLEAPLGGDVDQVRSFAQAATAQMQSIMEAFAAQVARLEPRPSAGLDPWGSV